MMRSRRRILFAFVLICAVSWRHAPASGDATERLKRDIEFLSSPRLDGRASASPGSAATARFIADEFGKAGLKPANGGSYFQEFRVSPVRLTPSNIKARMSRGEREQPFDVTSVSFPDPLQPVSVAGPVVFAGFGITAPELGYDDYSGLDVSGKIALVFDHEPRETDAQSPFNGTGLTKYAGPWYKTWNAQLHGAAAVLLAVEPVNAHRAVVRDPERANAPAQALIDGELRIPAFWIRPEGLRELFAESGRTPAEWQQEIERTLQPVSRALEGISVRVDAANRDPQSSPSCNVAGIVEGSDPDRSNDTILICAHYDHLGSRDGKLYPGANDNGSGVAGLLEIARRFADPALRARRSILLIAFGSEEQSMLGSYYYTAHPLRGLATTRAVLNLDMIGRNEEHSDDTVGAYEVSSDPSDKLNLVAAVYAPKLASLIQRESREVGLTLTDKLDRDSALRALFRCDHLPFLYKDVPAIWLFGGFHPGYHTPRDTPDRISYSKLQKVIELTIRTAVAAGNE